MMAEKILLLGSMKLGSQLYSQCLRDLQKITAAAKTERHAIQFIVDDSPAGLLAAKLLSGLYQEVTQMTTALAVPQAQTVLVYEEDSDADAHYEDTVYSLQNEDAEVYVRRMPKPAGQSGVKPPEDDPYADFKRAFTLVEKRIHPIPTKGPQVFREVEIRPNGGRPWFDI